jgi:6,7-dimethyl-8-ribityllumazine synthase
MPTIYHGDSDGSGLHVGIIVSRWNSVITDRLLQGALEALGKHGVADEKIDVVWVPGSWEIPVAAKKLAQSGRYQALIALGAIIRGDTPHFEYIANQASAGLSQVSLETGVPIAFGVLTTNNLEQALDRVGGKSGHKGAEAASAAVEMATVLGRLDSPAAAKDGAQAAQRLATA